MTKIACRSEPVLDTVALGGKAIVVLCTWFEAHLFLLGLS